MSSFLERSIFGVVERLFGFFGSSCDFLVLNMAKATKIVRNCTLQEPASNAVRKIELENAIWSRNTNGKSCVRRLDIAYKIAGLLRESEL